MKIYAIRHAKLPGGWRALIPAVEYYACPGWMTTKHYLYFYWAYWSIRFSWRTDL